MISVPELDSAGDGPVEALGVRRCLAHIIQYSSDVPLAITANESTELSETVHDGKEKYYYVKFRGIIVLFEVSIRKIASA